MRKIFKTNALRIITILMGMFLTQFAFSQTKSMNITSFTNVTDVDGSGNITAGDVINFNLHVKNDGNIQLNSLNFFLKI